MTKGVIKELSQSKDDIRFVLDSGAFTAWKAGKPLRLDDYCKFIESLPFEPWRYFTLDVIGNPHETLRNYETMLSRGFKPIPIFTRGEDPSVINDYYKTSDVVGIGGLVGTPGNKGFVKGIMKYIGDRKVHWLGFTSYDFISHYKPYMCDSSSWTGGVRFGKSKMYFDDNNWINLDINKIRNQSDTSLHLFIKQYGFDPVEFMDKRHWKSSGSGKGFNEVLNCRSFTRLQNDIQVKFNTKYFLACASAWQVRLMKSAYSYWKDRGVIA